MAVIPFIDLLKHEALPDCRTRAFWFDTRLSVAMPGLMIGVISALYILFLIKLVATVLFYAAPAEGVQQVALFIDSDVDDFWRNFNDLVLYAACLFIGENVARAALDVAALKPFVMDNARRFMRAAVGAVALVAVQFAFRILEKSFDLGVTGASGGLILFGGLTAAVFASLSLAFAQGAELKKEQDLTV